MTRIIKNAAKCLSCNTIIESNYVHDFVECKCFTNKVSNKGIAIDGGHEYLRRIGNLDNYEDLSEYDKNS